MLTKRNDFMTAAGCRVKKLTRASLMTLGMLTAAIAPAAFASDSQTTDKIVTVKFQLSDLQVEDGAYNVYAKLKKRATSYCRADRKSLEYLNQSVDDCTADLLEQFVESVDIDVLKTIHLSQQPAATTQIASN